jgi:elongator complex protein 3
MDFYSEIIRLIFTHSIESKLELHKIKVRLCKKYNMDIVPPDSEILNRLPGDLSDEDREYALCLLRKKSMRTISGVAIVAVMTSPESCPHGLCVPCPGGPEYNTPQSYTGHEPASLRAALNDFDPFLQTKNRLNQLKMIGHSVDKIDLIIMGGTFTARNPFYREWFVKRCFDALNNSSSNSLYEAKKLNENARSRCIGLTIETRPDWFRLQHADNSLDLGATRVELGVQSVYDDILSKIRRGHSVDDSVSATCIAKNCGLKVCYHMMPGLPGSDYTHDIEGFQSVFEDSNFKPDMLKIYPTLTIKGTKLYDMWRKDQYRPMNTQDATKLIADVKDIIPEWIRIQRIQRDVPAQFIDAGVDKSNLRQYVCAEMKSHGMECRCIRCREIGHRNLGEDTIFEKEDISMDCSYYNASGSEEIFLSLINDKSDSLLGYLRLRDISMSHRYELSQKPCMVIRELKVLGREIPLGVRSEKGLQHRGFGKELLSEAERICFEQYQKKYLFVLSGVGVKNYYRNLGFQDNGLYLFKKLVG